MNNYHVSDDGVARVCKADAGKCPVGGTHGQFESQQHANKFAEEVNAKRANYSENQKLSKKTYRKATEAEVNEFKAAVDGEERDSLMDHLLEKFSKESDAKKFVSMTEGSRYTYGEFEESSAGIEITLTAGDQDNYEEMSDFNKDAQKANAGMSKILSGYFGKPVKFRFEADDVG